ncbi:MAG TPA: sugar phosphate isomerase/epimerase family protein [Vicinamibacterales bacterium]
MRFGISTHLYHDRPLGPEHLRELAEFGFRQVELFATIGHVDYHDLSAIEALAGWLRDARLELHSVHAPIVDHRLNREWGAPLSTADSAEQARQLAVAECLAALQVARTIPFRFLVVHLGLPDELKPAAGANSRQAAQRSIEEIAAAATPLGVQVAVEVIPNKLSAARALVRLVEEDLELPAPGVGICLDMGHAFLMGDLVDAIEIVSGELVTTHVHDNRGTGDDHLVPFDGKIDWPTALMSLEKVGYEGLIMFELANTSTPREVLEKTVEVRRRFEAVLAPSHVLPPLPPECPGPE